MTGQFEMSSRAKLPKYARKGRPQVPPLIAAGVKEYARLYKVVYKFVPKITYDTATRFIRINNEPGVNFKRLKELTKQLRERAGDMT